MNDRSSWRSSILSLPHLTSLSGSTSCEDSFVALMALGLTGRGLGSGLPGATAPAVAKAAVPEAMGSMAEGLLLRDAARQGTLRQQLRGRSKGARRGRRLRRRRAAVLLWGPATAAAQARRSP